MEGFILEEGPFLFIIYGSSKLFVIGGGGGPAIFYWF